MIPFLRAALAVLVLLPAGAAWAGAPGERLAADYIKARFDIGKPDQAVVDEARDYVRKYGEVLDNHLAGRNYLLGDRLTVADFATAITLPYAATIHLPLEGFRNIERWHDRMNEMPAWREPFPALKAAA